MLEFRQHDITNANFLTFADKMLFICATINDLGE